MAPLPDRLRTLRTDRNMTTEQLAVAAGVSASTVSRIENGKHAPNRATIAALAVGLGCTTAELADQVTT